jgi:acyl-CoA thioesterase
MALQTLSSALELTPVGDGVLSASVGGDFSNGRIVDPPEKGFPFGGLLAALIAKGMGDGLGLAAPLRSLSIQYLSAPAYDTPILLKPHLLRSGRTVTYCELEARQDERLTHRAQATWGPDDAGGAAAGIIAPPPPLDSLDPAATLSGDLAPRFTQHVDYRLEGSSRILSGQPAEKAGERLWMRTNDGAPLDAVRLCYLMDALYPPAWTALRRPVRMSTVDLRYDIVRDPTPEIAPDGWAFFEFTLQDLGRGWTLDDLTVRGADGALIALGRQRRKVSPSRAAREG